MELLILSKLQWDLTAVTSYDFLDHLLDTLLNPNKNLRAKSNSKPKSPKVMLSSSTAESIRKHTERLMTLCATDVAFIEMAPSLVASSSLIVAIRHDKEDSLAAGVNLNEVIAKILEITTIDKVSIITNKLAFDLGK